MIVHRVIIVIRKGCAEGLRENKENRRKEKKRKKTKGKKFKVMQRKAKQRKSKKTKRKQSKAKKIISNRGKQSKEKGIVLFWFGGVSP